MTMAKKESYLFYRNPAAFQELKRKLQKELADFTPVQNSREAILNEIKRIDALNARENESLIKAS